MKMFWGQNEWAKKNFSKFLKYGFKKVKEQNEAVYILRLIPDKLLQSAERSFGLPQGSLDATSKYNPYLETSSVDLKTKELFEQYINSIDGIADVMADTYQMSVWMLIKNLQSVRPTNKNIHLIKFRNLAESIFAKNTTSNNGYAVQTTNQARDDYMLLARYAAESKNSDLSDILFASLNEAFEFALGIRNVILK